MEHALNLIRALSKTVFWPFRSSIKFDIMGSRVYNLAILSKDLISRNNCKNDFPSQNKYGLPQNIALCPVLIAAPKWREASRYHHVHNDAEAPQVRQRRGVATFHDLGAHELQRAAHVDGNHVRVSWCSQ